MAKAKGLGKGLDSLIPSRKTAVSAGTENVTAKSDKSTVSSAKKVDMVDKSAENSTKSGSVDGKTEEKSTKMDSLVNIIKIEANRKQPRKKFEKAALEELAESIKTYGVIQPLVVRPIGDHYEIVAGERRWRAAKLAGVKEVPVIIREYDDRQVAEIALVENLQREDLNPIEEAMGYQALIKEYGLTQEEAAQKVSKSRTVVTNSLRLLKLAKKVQKMVEKGELSTGHAKVILGIENQEKQLEAAEKVVLDKLSVRQTEALVKSILNPAVPKVKEPLPAAEQYDALGMKMTEVLGTKVKINRKSAGKGRLEIDYYSPEDLERIAELLGVKL